MAAKFIFSKSISLRDLINNSEIIEVLRPPQRKCIRCRSTELPHPDEEYTFMGVPVRNDVCLDCHAGAAEEKIERRQVLMGQIENDAYRNS
jgi:hypothetical protein